MKSLKISGLTEKVNQALKNPDLSALSRLEFDLLMQNLRELYEELDSLRTSNEASPRINPFNTQKPAAEFTKPATLINRKTLLANEDLLLDDSPVVREINAPQNKVNATRGKETFVLPSEDKTEKLRSSVRSINESIQTPATLNEKLKTSEAKEVHKKLASKPLKELIDLNQKFVILNELFKSNSEAFSAAVNHLDSLDNYGDAETFIKTQLINNYYWDESAPSARLFMKLVQQKFAVEF